VRGLPRAAARLARRCLHAPDGSSWALQAWQRSLPNYGVFASGARSAWDIRLSHWTGPLAALTVKTDWTYRRFDHLYGSLMYQGKPVYGFHTTRLGSPLDGYGRLIYVDTLDSRYGSGWHRENSFVAHRPKGIFCYGFFPHRGRPAGRGTRYRATAIGPGVTPDVLWQGPTPGPYNRAAPRPCERPAASSIFRPVMSAELKSTRLTRLSSIAAARSVVGRHRPRAGRPVRSRVSSRAHRTAKPSA
jgi:hypothetical protein